MLREMRRGNERPARPRALGVHAMTIIGWTLTAIRAGVIAVGTIVLAGSQAAAQAPLVEREFAEKWMVVTSDRVNLRCGSGSPWYAVMQVGQGDLLRADGEDYGWIRVRYPEGAPALVRAREAELDEDAGVVTLTAPSPLRALNMTGGVQTCWRQLMESALPAGTVLRYVETRTDESGETGYVVVAPEGAKGFVAKQFVRDATRAEIDAHQREGEQQAEQPARTPPQAAQTDDAGAQDGAGDDAQEAAQGGEDGEMTEPALAEAPAGAQEEAQGDAGEMAQGDAPADDGMDAGTEEIVEAYEEAAEELAAEGDGEAGAGDAPAAVRETPTLEGLGGAFERVMKQDAEDAELETLIGEYEGLRATLGDSQTDRAHQEAIDTRLELLRLRLDVQRRLQRIAEVELEADENTGRVRTAIDSLDPTYTAVGRLSVSAIYDGRRLPLMFRLVSVESGPSRTIAYVTPESGVDVRGRIGTVVGVVGERVERSTLKLPLIRPTRIDVIATPAEAGAQDR